MKKILYLIAVAMTFAFTSCSEDACDHIVINTPPGRSLFVGSWYAEDVNEETTFNESGTLYDRYCNTLRGAETEGRWEYDQANKKLTERFLFLGQNQFFDWTVKDCSEIYIKMTSDKKGTCEMERIVAMYKMEVGESVNFSFPEDIYNYKDEKYSNKYNVKSFSSRNSRLASVDDEGKIVANGEKGTTYIKIETDNGNVWAKVVVGDDCFDIWYDWVSFIGADYNTLSKALGQYSAIGDDGYSYGWRLSELNDQASEVDMFLNTSSGKVEQIALSLKSIPESEVIAYMDSHYYPCPELGDNYYTTCATIASSAAVVFFSKENNSIFFIDASGYKITNYSDCLGLTKEEIKSKLGKPSASSDNTLRYKVNNKYFLYVDYIFDNSTNTVHSIVCKMASNSLASFVQDKIKGTFEGMNDYADDSDYTNSKYALINKPTIDEATVEIVVEGKSSTGSVAYYDLTHYGLDYDYSSLIGKQADVLKNVFGNPVADNVTGFIWINPSTVAKETWTFLNKKTMLASDIYLKIRDGKDANVNEFLSANYTQSEYLEDGYYTTGETVEQSNAVVWYDNTKKELHYLDPQKYAWKDYVYAFGHTLEEIEAEFSESNGYRDWGNNMYGDLDCYYSTIVAFGFDSNKVINFKLAFKVGIAEQIKKVLSSKYRFIRESEDKTYLVYRDDEDLQKAKVQIQYDPNHDIAMFFDCDYYVRETSRSQAISTTVIFMPTDKSVEIQAVK